jgi:hypothetical protein
LSPLLALWLLLAGPDSPVDAPQIYRLSLAAAKQDYFLPAPRQRKVLFKVDARQAPPKSRLMFLTPLRAGRHQLQFQLAGATADLTLVVAVPLASGRSSVTVQIDSPGRYDFGFWTGDIRSPPKEYRFTVVGPVTTRTFELDLP